MTAIAILKTGALGDVLRTTSILPGLHARYPGLEVTWVTAPGAVDLVRTHPLVGRVVAVDPDDAAGMAAVAAELGRTTWDRVLSLDDEEPVAALASRLQAAGGDVSGTRVEGGRVVYSADTAPWFEMGLLSAHGKEQADRLKRENTRSHAEIYASMLGVEPAEPGLEIPDESLRRAAAFAERHELGAHGPVVGLNTGADGRWAAKQLPVERVVELAVRIADDLGPVTYLVLGGVGEAERNRAIVAGLADAAGRLRTVDAGCDNELLDFAALIDRLDLLVTSDSLGMHVAIARKRPVVAFFAPTSAAEIDLYGRGEKVASTAHDYCSYRGDADTSTLTAERLAEAVRRVLGAPE